jgi:hypothetical protein
MTARELYAAVVLGVIIFKRLESPESTITSEGIAQVVWGVVDAVVKEGAKR